MKYRFIQAARNPALTGYIVFEDFDEVGRPIGSYADLPLLFGYEKSLNAPILPFTEFPPGNFSTPSTSSIYVVSFGEHGLHGIERSPIKIEDVGLLPDRVTYNTHVSWNVGLVAESLFCFTRLAGVQQAPITE